MKYFIALIASTALALVSTSSWSANNYPPALFNYIDVLGTTLPPLTQGSLGIGGVKSTIPNISGYNAGYIFLNANNGLDEIGSGSINDHTWSNNSGLAVLVNPTGTQDIAVRGNATIDGNLIVDGTLNAGATTLASLSITGAATGITKTFGTNTTDLATTAFVEAAINSLAPLASPTFTGIPVAPTASSGTNTTQIATTAFVQSAVGTGTSSSTVYTNAGIKAISITSLSTGNRVVRGGFTTIGDSPDIPYTLEKGANCTISGGDNGSQIQPTTGTACWIWTPPQGGTIPMSFGAAGTGTTNDTAAVQAASEAASLAGIPLRFGPPYLYQINTAIVFDHPGDWEGPYRYGAWSNGSTGGITKCPWGLVASSTSIGDMIHATAITGTIRGICIDATGSNTTQASSGAGIDLSPTLLTSYQSGWTIEYNTILDAYDGIDVNGFGYSSACCGAGTAADGVSVARNTIISPYNIGISNGLNTANAATVGISYVDNVINCGVNGTHRAAEGFAVFDGGIYYDGTNNGPEGCQTGFLVAPGALSGQSQNAQVVLRGVLGDQSTVVNALFQPSSTSGVGGVIDFVQGEGIWSSSTGNQSTLNINCTASNVSCQEFNFSDAIFHSGNGITGSIISIEGYIYDFSLTGSNVCSFGTPGSGATAISLSATTSPSGRYTIVGNRIGTGCPGSAVANGINISISGSSANGAVTVVGNDMSAVTNPIVYVPTATDHVIIRNNMGIDDQIGSVTAATTISPDSAHVRFGVLGSSTTISTINGGWSNREIDLITANSQTFATGGNICNAITSSASLLIRAVYNGGTNCWNLD